MTSSGRHAPVLPLAWLMLVVGQALATWTWEAAACALMAAAGAGIGLRHALSPRLLRLAPVSSLSLAGYSTFHFVLPPLVTAMEGQPLTTYLERPTDVLLHAMVCLLALIVSHRVYLGSGLLQAARQTLCGRLYGPLGLFRMPPPAHLFAMGAMGLLAAAWLTFTLGAAQLHEAESGIVTKLMQGLYPLAWVPLALMVQPLVDRRPMPPGQWPVLLLYALAVALVGLGRNSRSAVLIGFVSIGIAWAYLALIDPQRRASAFSTRRLVLAAVVVWVAGGPLADLATSMVIAREERAEVSALQVIQTTASVFLDKERIRSFRAAEGGSSNEFWDERYVDNVFASRLCNLRFADATLVLAHELDAAQSASLRSLEWQRVVGLLPRPILEQVSPETDKDFVNSGSGGDLLLFVATNAPRAMGGFRTGSIFASGYGQFGWFYVPLLMLLALFTFTLVDALTRRVADPAAPGGWSPVFSPMLVVSLFTWCYYFTSAATGAESMSELLAYLVRGWVQDALVYATVFWLSAALVMAGGLGRKAPT
ncbi:MAG: hypothetical protein ACK4PH_12220 [Aquincola tertiaricarbonis]|uniref:hypothetical protein n=1 Tax=Aquincola sp. J276 TaxID=2898432 RepID=UPI002150B527|nr:hypothetical protein [Aquincola sp. J276]MCR5865813.1 hypothetical protein [Aquincola sp. J276]